MKTALFTLDHSSRMTSARRSAGRLFIHGTLFSTLILQKFGFTFGRRYFALALPLCIALFAWAVMSGKTRVNARALTLYCLFICGAFFSAIAVLISPGAADNFSIPSLALLIVLYSFFVIEPSAEFDASMVVDIFLKYALALALLGIFQYGAQFAGLHISSLSSLIPQLKPFLLEDFFNSNAILEYGSNIVRSNGIFLGEPSSFSQLIVIAASIEIVVKKRFKFLPVYAAAYLTSFSGTGLFALAVALAANALFSFKDALRLPAIALGGVVIFAVLAVAAPDITNRYAHRLLEFQSEGSSGYTRYVAQGRAWSDMIDSGSILTGNGPGSFDRTFLIRGVSTNPVLKLTHDYGLFTMLFGLGLLASTIWSRHARFISLLFLSIFQLGEGSELNVCFLIPMIIVCVWGVKRLPIRESAPTARNVGFERRMVLS
jgi:hypothetical protein